MKQTVFKNSLLRPYFEGWYFKHVKNDQTVIFIPGISITSHKKEAFIQVITNEHSYYINYPFNLVSIDRKRMRIQIGGNIFSKKGCKICIHKEGLAIEGVLSYGKLNLVKYPVMGPFEFLSHILCSHSIYSMDHALYGTLTVNGKAICFNQGRGYIEGDKGRTFPDKYLWTQCNHFKHPFTAITAAVAMVQKSPLSFLGTFAVINYKGQEYRFATYLNCKIQIISKTKIVLTQRNKVLIISLSKDHPLSLVAPKKGAMLRTIKEHINCSVHYYFKVGDHVVIDETCDHACFETTL